MTLNATILRRGLSLVLCCLLLMLAAVRPQAADRQYADEASMAAAVREMITRYIAPQDYSDTADFGLTEAQTQALGEFVSQLTASAATDYDKALLIAQWIAQNIYYDRPTYYGSAQRQQDPFSVYSNRLAICYGYTNLTSCLMRQAGLPCLTVCGSVTTQGGAEHRWNAVWIGSEWLYLDTTWMSGNYTNDGVALCAGTVDASWFGYSAEQEVPRRRFTSPVQYLTEDGCCYAVSLDWDNCRIELRLIGSLFYFQPIRTYPGFSDVPQQAWYADAVQQAYCLGLINGDGSCYRPDDPVTLAEAIKLAAVVHSTYAGRSENPGNSSGAAWYSPYVDYALKHGIIQADDFSDYLRPATRAELAYLLANSVSERALGRMHQISQVPGLSSDTKYEKQILLLYQAGVLMGTDASGSFDPDAEVTRAQTAVVLFRLTDPDSRI